MKLLLFSDVHCDLEAARQLVESARDVDVVICAGDLGNQRRGLDVVTAALSAIEKPTVLVPGNAESDEELAVACRDWPAARVLHGSGVSIDGVEFFGIGGATPVTPFGSWSFDLTEEQARDRLSSCPARCVLVSHSPPKGVLDVSADGQSLGSEAVLETVRRKKPALVVCGHIHACAGQTARVETTTVINAGPRGVVWDL